MQNTDTFRKDDVNKLLNELFKPSNECENVFNFIKNEKNKTLLSKKIDKNNAYFTEGSNLLHLLAILDFGYAINIAYKEIYNYQNQIINCLHEKIFPTNNHPVDIDLLLAIKKLDLIDKKDANGYTPKMLAEKSEKTNTYFTNKESMEKIIKLIEIIKKIQGFDDKGFDDSISQNMLKSLRGDSPVVSHSVNENNGSDQHNIDVIENIKKISENSNEILPETIFMEMPLNTNFEIKVVDGRKRVYFYSPFIHNNNNNNNNQVGASDSITKKNFDIIHEKRKSKMTRKRKLKRVLKRKIKPDFFIDIPITTNVETRIVDDRKRVYFQ